MGRSVFAAIVVAASLGAMTSLASAQEVEPLVPVPPLPASPEAPPQPGQPLIVGKTVTDRPRPELDPLGVPVGTFFLFPRVEVDGSYNDNIYATSNDTTSDWITTLMPSFDLISNWPQNLLELSGGAALGRYASHSSQDFDNAFGSLKGRLDVTADQSLSGGLEVDRLNEPRTAPDFPGTASEPVIYTTYTGTAGFAQNHTVVGYEVDGALTRTEYESVPAFGGGIISQDDRNETGYQGTARVYYEFQPGYQAYLRGSGNYQDFDHAAGLRTITGVGTVYIPARNSTGYRVDAGTRIDLSGVTYADVYVGYLSQMYASSFFGNIDGVDAGVALVWNVTTLDTIKVNGTRTVDNADSEIVGASSASAGYLASTVGGSIDHELLRNLLLNANASYERDDWQNINREDNIYGIGLGAKYLMTRNLYFGPSWTFQQRTTSGSASAIAGAAYSQNIFMLRISTQL